MNSYPLKSRAHSVRLGRYWQLVFGVAAMMSISSAQYVWTLFVPPLQQTLGVSLAAVQATFSIFVVLQTALSPIQGILVDRLGPRLLISIGGGLMMASWITAAYASSLTGLYASYGVLGGLGSGIIYVGVVGLVVRWFPDRRGFATGLAAAGYGFGAIFTTLPIANMVRQSGYQHTLIFFGIAQGLVAIIAAQGLAQPDHAFHPTSPSPKGGPATASAATPIAQSSTPVSTMLRTSLFWCLFVMMAMMAAGGLMVISQMAVFAKDFGVDKVSVWGLAALPLAMSLDRLTNGLTRPLFGWISDRIGREQTMALAFTLEAMAVTLLLTESHNALAFVLLSGLVFLGWGEIFALFPATLIDTFGAEQATTKYGFLYMAQGVGAVLGGPLAALLYEQQQSWTPLFTTVVTLDLSAALLAIFLLRPLRRKFFQQMAWPQQSKRAA